MTYDPRKPFSLFGRKLSVAYIVSCFGQAGHLIATNVFIFNPIEAEIHQSNTAIHLNLISDRNQAE